MDPAWLLPAGIGLGALAVGLALGFVLRRPDRALREQVQQLEGELQESRRSYDAHRARVEKHFERTSDLFRDLTEQYAALYSHLAEGARDLCPEGGPALGRGLDDPLLKAHFGSPLPAGDDELETDPEPDLGELETDLEEPGGPPPKR